MRVWLSGRPSGHRAFTAAVVASEGQRNRIPRGTPLAPGGHGLPASPRCLCKYNVLLCEGPDAGAAWPSWGRVYGGQLGRRDRPLTSPPEAPGDGPPAAPKKGDKGKVTGPRNLAEGQEASSSEERSGAMLQLTSGLLDRLRFLVSPLSTPRPPLSLSLCPPFSCCMKMKQQKMFSVNHSGSTVGLSSG